MQIAESLSAETAQSEFAGQPVKQTLNGSTSVEQLKDPGRLTQVELTQLLIALSRHSFMSVHSFEIISTMKPESQMHSADMKSREGLQLDPKLQAILSHTLKGSFEVVHQNP